MNEVPDSHTVATYNDGCDDGLDYVYAPEYEFELGDIIEVGKRIKIHVDGELRNEPVLYMQIERRHRELDVDAREWYTNYRVGYYHAPGMKITDDSLPADDLEDETTTDLSPDELWDKHAER